MIHKDAGSAVKSAIIDKTNAQAETTPNCRIGGSGDSASARKPPALMNVAKTIAPPETNRAWRSAVSTPP
jgi:hypothetical protein